MGSCMKAWLYSVTNLGQLRGSWSVQQKDLSGESEIAEFATELLEDEAAAVLARIDKNSNLTSAALTELYPLVRGIASRSDAWRAITPEYWRDGIQIILVDSMLPLGHRSFLTFTFPYERQLSEDQLQSLVARVVAGQDGCFSG